MTPLESSIPKTHTCKACGIPILSKNYGIWVCSLSCLKATRMKKKICEQCHREYETWVNGQKYCSHKCSEIAHTISVIQVCPQCGKEFRHRNPSRALPNSCCSPKCSGIQRRGENSVLYRGNRRADRGWTWKDMKEKARERDNGNCISILHDSSYVPYRVEKCSVDHIIPYRVVIAWKQSGEDVDPNHIDNLASMCRRCHQIKTTRIESKLMTGDIAGFIEGLRTCLPKETVERVLSIYGILRSDRTFEVAKDWTFDRRPSNKPRINAKSRGEKHWNSKLTKDQAMSIICRRSESKKVLAKEYGIGVGQIRDIICGASWKNLERCYV